MATSKNINWKVESITLDRNNTFEHPFISAELSTSVLPKTWSPNELAMDLQDHLNKKSVPEIKKVIFNPPCTIVLWSDNTKTVVKCQEGDKYDPEKGLAMAIVKKMYGNTGKYCEIFKKWIKEEEDYPEIPSISYEEAIEKIKKSVDDMRVKILNNLYGAPKKVDSEELANLADKFDRVNVASPSEIRAALNECEKKEQAKARAEKLEKETGWISAKDRMPDKSGDYLVYDLSSRSVYVYEFEIDSIADATYWHNCIPHWMPCPAAPNKKGE